MSLKKKIQYLILTLYCKILLILLLNKLNIQIYAWNSSFRIATQMYSSWDYGIQSELYHMLKHNWYNWFGMSNEWVFFHINYILAMRTEHYL